MIKLPSLQNGRENEIRKSIESNWNMTCTQETLNKMSYYQINVVQPWHTGRECGELIEKKSVFSNHIGGGSIKTSICVGGINQMNNYFIF